MSRFKFVAVLLALALCFSPMVSYEANASQDELLMLKIGTGFPGGLWFPASAVLAAEIERALGAIGINASASIQSTPGVFNVAAVNEGNEMQLTITTSQNQYLAYHGLPPFTQRMENIRLIGTQELMLTQIVVPAASNINSLADLRDRTINIGRPATTNRIMIEALLRSYGLTFDDIRASGGQTMELTWDDATTMMQDGHMDCIITYGGIMPSIVNLVFQPGVRFLSISEEAKERIFADPTMMGFVPAVIQAGVYEGQDYEVRTVAVQTTILANKNLSDDVVYAITRAIYESGYHVAIFGPTMAQGWPRVCNPEDLPKVANIPVHPGALRYFESIGIAIPGQLEIPAQ